MNPFNFVRVTFTLIASLLAWMPLTARAQSDAAKITIVSVLTQAKEEAEKADDETGRIRLRAFVAYLIGRTGQEIAFAEYVAQARAAQRALALEASADEDLKFNIELEAKAKRAFRDGDEHRALELLKECRPRLMGSPCGPSDTFVAGHEVFVQILLLNWEIDADQFEAALHRLKSASWPPDLYQYVLVFSGPTIAGGDQGRRAEIQRLFNQSGLSATACIVDEGSIFRRGTAPTRPPKPRPLGEAAVLRRLACEGKVETALAMAVSSKGVEQRLRAFAAIAEGLAGVPGFAGE